MIVIVIYTLLVQRLVPALGKLHRSNIDVFRSMGLAYFRCQSCQNKLWRSIVLLSTDNYRMTEASVLTILKSVMKLMLHLGSILNNYGLYKTGTK